MSLVPVILCGGEGRRLWPLSTPERPKPFAPLIGGRSLFDLTVERLAPFGPPVVVCGAGHVEAARAALAGRTATLLVEPEGRDTAAAVMAAAAWIARERPEAVLAVFPADHAIGWVEAFRADVAEAAAAASDGALVVFGVRPDGLGTGYGHIVPGAGEGRARPVARFVEKPDAARAEALTADGALWNAGAFVFRADALLAEARRLAPEIAAAAERAVADAVSDAGEARLGAAYGAAPRLAFDRAVMERTDRALVLPVEWDWSDLGDWAAVKAAGAADADGNVSEGAARLVAAADCLVRAGPGRRVTVVGGRRLAVIVEGDEVLVLDLDRAQALKDI